MRHHIGARRCSPAPAAAHVGAPRATRLVPDRGRPEHLPLGRPRRRQPARARRLRPAVVCRLAQRQGEPGPSLPSQSPEKLTRCPPLGNPADPRQCVLATGQRHHRQSPRGPPRSVLPASVHRQGGRRPGAAAVGAEPVDRGPDGDAAELPAVHQQAQGFRECLFSSSPSDVVGIDRYAPPRSCRSTTSRSEAPVPRSQLSPPDTRCPRLISSRACKRDCMSTLAQRELGRSRSAAGGETGAEVELLCPMTKHF